MSSWERKLRSFTHRITQMSDDFAIFILTYKRANNQLTYRYLKKCGYDGKIYFVLSDDDPTISEYQDKYGTDNCLIFNKAESLELFDIGDNFDDERAVVYARNKLYDLAKSKGIKWAFVLDDDYVGMRYRINVRQQYENRTPVIRSALKLIAAGLEYFKATKALS